MTYKEARVYLDEVSKYGSVLGLDTIRGLLRELGHPQDDLKFIHIAGTNGKGSVLAYTSTILSEAGYRTGRYVSPTVVSYLERIQIDGKWIPEDEFAELVEEVKKAIARMEARGEASPTVFEAETAVAFLYFRKRRCDLVVLETGLGGLLDATNIVKNTELAVFASISRDHMGFLGESLEEIAANKAGIIKPGCTVVTSLQKPEVMTVLVEKARELKCGMEVVYPREAVMVEENWDGQRFSYREWENIRISLAGRFQIENAVTVLGVIRALRNRGYEISRRAVEEGFAKTTWPGRLTCVARDPLVLVDGAHNEEAALRLRESLVQYFPSRRMLFIMGVFRDKEYDKIAEIMGPLADKIYTVELPDQGRTLGADELKQALLPYCVGAVEEASGIEEAVREACASARKDDVVLAFGSLSYLGRVMELTEDMGEKL
ncbi:bifunctional folylpolyglutamate synthase/dihydrofolate synthase [Muricomes sp. OA1]|uniref:tetrahydrofolate synthase n=1 Tax=Hungatella hathewayi TaxID=154046 RepID=A0A3E2WKZ9_9FIRM|nr:MULTISPECIES: folylpolyglutamate synthase/dihydrofolate synthase family protein [Clostridia]MCH1974436.1 bifunctional folylpolyglutamate synthase/dihydrofolate synthase [Muricomes sp. OA1]RGC27761.1 bifunctional folylpolyglutamate synthase/dihydrofolate synthase [Hungatella hathewayi]GKH33213.1 bifunctional folylpolyglutamate synthase/dihydrofolate synthase [Faecalicatena contorta]